MFCHRFPCFDHSVKRLSFQGVIPIEDQAAVEPMPRKYFANLAVCLALALSLQSGALAITPDDPGPGDVAFTVNSLTGRHTISPYIYGLNQYATSVNNVGMTRLGGNRWTGYNWETNASNAGRDWYYHSDTLLGSGAPGNAVRPTLQQADAGDYATVVTLPMAGYVAADTNGTIDESDAAPSLNRLHIQEPKKQTVYPGSSLSLTPNLNDSYVFTDEFVHWVENTRQNDQTVFYSLDNEPALWGETLPAGWDSGTPPVPCCNPANGTFPSSGGRTHGILHPYEPTYAEMRTRTIENATAIKDVNPSAVVFGGVGYGYAEFTGLQGAPDRVSSPSHPGGDQTGELHYYEWLLNEVAQEEANQGRTLMDVLDLHWYPEAQGTAGRITNNNNSPGQVAARVQAPRSLWDPSYTETSWISLWETWQGSPGNHGPVTLLPRVQRDIDDFKPGTRIAITEYNYGGTNHISGAIAQADFLGIMGEQDVFAASWWSLHGESNSQFVLGAFEMFRDFDGAGGMFGDLSLDAETDSIADSAVYASLSTDNPNEMVLIAINRTDSPQDAAIAITTDRLFEVAEVYQLTSSSSNPQRGADIDITLTNAFQYTMPAFSVSTLRLISDGFEADFDGDGDVDTDDLTHPTLGWQARYGIDLTSQDFLLWQAQNGSGVAGQEAARTVPEPISLAMLCVFIALVGCQTPRSELKVLREAGYSKAEQ